MQGMWKSLILPSTSNWFFGTWTNCFRAEWFSYIVYSLLSSVEKFQVSAEEGDHEDKSVMPRLRKSEVENSTCKVVIKPTQVGEYYDMVSFLMKNFLGD